MRARTLSMDVPLVIWGAKGRSRLMKRDLTISSAVSRGSCSAISTTTFASSVAVWHLSIRAR